MKERKSKGFGYIFRKILLLLFLLLLVALLAAGIWFYNEYGRELLELKDEAGLIAARSTRDDFVSSETSICYYSDGSVMQTLSGTKNVYYLPYESIPQAAVNAVLAVEDRKFFSHKGYDVYAIARAAKAYLENDGQIRQGGSTITQQLARNIYLTNEKTVKRKVTEIFLAAALERKYSKYDILEFYLNNIYFANGYYGLQAASKGYFAVTAGDLSLSQIAFLCGIPNSPSAYDPYAHFENALERRDSVLLQMYENGYISAQEYKAALAEEIVLKTTESENNNYEETYTYSCAIKALMEAEGFTLQYYFTSEEDEEAYDLLYNAEYSRIWRNLYAKGYRIYTSINPEKQEQLQQAIDSELAEFTETSDEGVYKLQAAGTCIDNETGFVVAIVGGRSQEHTGYTLNRAYQSPRQPGSAIKPLIVYTPAFERGYYPDTIVVDEKFDGGPRNSGNVYSGEIDIRYAVSVSKNTIAWKLLGEIGIDVGLGYLKRMNFASIVDTDYYPAAALGGLTYGATTVEMAAGFATIANEGVYRTPTCIMRITDAEGNAIVDNTTTITLAAHTAESKRIYEKNAANMMTDVLTTVMKSGTGRSLALTGISSAGKTGTTNNQKDGWFVGFTGYYTTGIWVGCDMPEEMEDLKGNTYPGRIWQSFMQQIHEGRTDIELGGYIDDRPIEERYPYGWIDNDGDGIPDGYPEGWVDTDGDGIPDDYPDNWTDFDGDGVPDGPADWLSDVTDYEGADVESGDGEDTSEGTSGWQSGGTASDASENGSAVGDDADSESADGADDSGIIWIDPRTGAVIDNGTGSTAEGLSGTGSNTDAGESTGTAENTDGNVTNAGGNADVGEGTGVTGNTAGNVTDAGGSAGAGNTADAGNNAGAEEGTGNTAENTAENINDGDYNSSTDDETDGGIIWVNPGEDDHIWVSPGEGYIWVDPRAEGGETD